MAREPDFPKVRHIALSTGEPGGGANAVVVPFEDGEASRAEIRRRAGDKRFAHVLFRSRTCELVGKRRRDGAAEWQVTEVILERGKHHLFGVWNDLKNGAAQCLKRGALRLLDATQVLVNRRGGHRYAV